MKVVFLPEVMDYFLELTDVLYDMGYFSFIESAIKYSDILFEDIKNNLPVKHKKEAPEYFNKYGKKMSYAIFRKNKNTSWYVFFNIYNTKEETIYLVRFISNNHMISQYL
jgi:hypothetical protein